MQKEINKRARRKYGRSVNQALSVIRAARGMYRDSNFYDGLIKKLIQAKRDPKKYILVCRREKTINY